ncbi:hypothetical protein HPT25_27635 [Bacillus sp. BRMEA1]|uniref:hypothetical protein n=1 Tax=Neobacillus endophyticus TaxID=2738405 RepID=UPI001566F359|nr:hypothetical protein [Neobacillus endophyticus]NRD81068.1 hypothetical protein [Neobacillus endophyticus]
MDRISCLAYLLYNSSENQDIRETAIQLLNGDVSIRDLKKNTAIKATLVTLESLLKKRRVNMNQVRQFVEKYMFVEV